MKTGAAMDMSRSKRGVFTNMGAMHSLAKIEDIDILEYIERKKRNEFTDELLRAEENLFDGNLGGFFIKCWRLSLNRSTFGSLELTIMMS